ncbi:tetraspanin-33-like [Physella acuta]|uniref:tetraspanin-33-like n=1 Tax=Physella acuta TaxID=109671 RepID=UPI0027DBA9FE|nr:tetraspanin-33-like [Physella acuta]
MQDVLPDPEEMRREVRNSKHNLVCDETEGFEGVTNRGFIIDSPYLTKNLTAQEPGDISTSSDDDEDQTSDYDNKDLPSSSERGSSQVIKRPDRRFTLPRPYSASFAEDLISYNRRENFPKAWHSLKINFIERSLLADRSKVASSTGEAPSEMQTSIEYEDESLEDLPSPENNGKRPVAEEDSLSLEFFVPGKKKYIRLHRRTFIHFLFKYSIFLLTFLFWVASLSGIGFGTWMLLSNGAIIDDVTDVFLDPYVLMCVVSGIIFLVTFFGCVGALRENVLLLNLFRFSMTAVLVLEGLLSTLVFLFYTMPEFRRAVKVGPEEVLKKAVKQYFDDEGMKKWIDTVQKEFKCCGVSMSDDGYLDWQENQYYNCSASNPSVYRCSVPLSCCIFEPGEYINYRCGADIMNREELYVNHMINTKGCMKSFGEWLGKNDVVIGYVALGVIIPQILGVIAARYFVKHLSKHTTWRQLSDPVQIISPT